MMNLRFMLSCILTMAFAGAAGAATNQTSSCLDGAGDWSSGGGYTNISAIAQPGGVSVSSQGDMVNYAGFINTFSMRPNLDTDGDGVENELDQDNDGDTLSDTDELAGSSFSPGTATDINMADSDLDGTDDYAESVAGTDPTDIDAHLAIIAINDTPAGREIQWTARSNKTYRIRREDGGIAGRPETVLGSTTVTTPATGAWDVATGTYTDPGSSGSRAYAVEALP
jgi:hypothetical protein